MAHSDDISMASSGRGSEQWRPLSWDRYTQKLTKRAFLCAFAHLWTIMLQHLIISCRKIQHSRQRATG